MRGVTSPLLVAVLLLPSLVPPTSALPPGSDGGEGPLACADLDPLPTDPKELLETATLRDRFALVTVAGAVGDVELDEIKIGRVSPGETLHVLLKVTGIERRLVVQCLPTAGATVQYFDAPVVEVRALPARVLTETYTRGGLRALGMPNLVDVYMATSTGGHVRVDLNAEGAPLPTTVQAFGEDPNAMLASVQRTAELLASDLDLTAELLAILGRLAAFCGSDVGNTLLCGATQVERLLARYGVPALAAQDLAHRMATDERCTTQSVFDLPPFVAQLVHDAEDHKFPTLGPCGDVLAEWADETFEAETGSSLVRITEVTAHALGLQGFGTSGPCGDSPRVLPSPSGTLSTAVQNRTLASRQHDCLELIIASLRPVRYQWRPELTIEAMGSLDFGPSALVFAKAYVGEGRLTFSSQGPVVLDLKLDLEPGAETVGDLVRDAEAAVDALEPVTGSLPGVNDALAPGDALLEEIAGLGDLTAPSLRDTINRTGRIPLNDSVLEESVQAALDVLNGATSPNLRRALDMTPQRCDLGTGQPSPASCQFQTDASPFLDGFENVWKASPAGSPPDLTTAWTIDGSNPRAALADFLASPASPPRIDGEAGGSGARELLLFVPDRLDARFAEPLSSGVADLPLGGAAGEALALEAFAAERLRDLRNELGDAGVPAGAADRVPRELLLTGTDFHVRVDGSHVTVLREIQPAFRLLNLREGVDRGDLDLDGALDVEEARGPIVQPFENGDPLPPRIPLDSTNPDSDGDRMTDGWELAFCEDPESFILSCGPGLAPWLPDALGDADHDQMANGLEHDRTLAANLDTACFATYRWSCLRSAAEDWSCSSPASLRAWAPDPSALDSDCDGFYDGWEAAFGFDPLDASVPAPGEDADGDGWSHAEEFEFFRHAIEVYREQTGADFATAIAAVTAPGAFGSRLDPLDADSDDDGLPDAYEGVRGLGANPDDPDALPRRLRPLQNDAAGHGDADGLAHLAEFRWSLKYLLAKDPNRQLGVLARDLTAAGLDPFQTDTDGDQAQDGTEVAGYDAGDPCSDPLVPEIDCDADGVPDLIERFIADDPSLTAAQRQQAANAYPCVAPVTELPTRNRMSRLNPDSDGDGIPDGYECWFGLKPTTEADAAEDPDLDGLTNLLEADLTFRLTPDRRADADYFRPPAAGSMRVLLPRAVANLANPVDHDGDLLPDSYELALGLDPLTDDANEDRDRDGLANCAEFRCTPAPQDQGTPHQRWIADRVNLKDEALFRALHVYVPNPAEEDSDGDGMPDGWESAHSLDPGSAADATLDPDGDQLSSLEEYAYTANLHADGIREQGTRFLLTLDNEEQLLPEVADGDGDSMPDGLEVAYRREQGCQTLDTVQTGRAPWMHCIDPLDSSDANLDLDLDRLTNQQELVGWEVTVQTHKARDPAFAPDQRTERRHVTANPLKADTAGSGLLDDDKAPRALSGCPETLVALDPNTVDTDDDGVSDRVEWWEWTAVQGLPEDIDGDCFANAVDADSDGDSFLLDGETFVDLTDGSELSLRMSDPTRADTDRDGVPDGREFHQWRLAGRDPLNEDVDGDQLSPLQDPDSDGDAIDDGYEFQVGLEPWTPQPAETRSDPDALTDLCEYRLTRGDHLDVCPGQPAAAAGPESSPEAPTGPRLASVDAADAGPPTDFSSPLCVNAKYRDCEGDGVPDDYEYNHSRRFEPQGLFLVGCDESAWTYHAPSGALDACAEGYASDELGQDASLFMRRAMVQEFEAPVVGGLRLRYDLGLQAVAEPCLYHRTCRFGIQLTGLAEIALTVSVDHNPCRLDKVQVFIAGRLLKASQLGPAPSGNEWEHFAQTTDATFVPIQADHDACVRARGETGTGRYNFRVALPKDLFTVAGFDHLTYAGHGYLQVLLWGFSSQGVLQMGTTFQKDLHLLGGGVNTLYDTNQDLSMSLGAHGRERGENILLATRDYLVEFLSRARGEAGPNPVADARAYLGDALRDYVDRVNWFSTGYRDALRACHAAVDPDEPDVHVVRECPEVRRRTEEALEARTRLAVGLAVFRDLTWAVSEATFHAGNLMFQGGAKHTEVSRLVLSLFAPTFRLDPNQVPAADFWDWLMPSLGAGAQTGCDGYHQVANAFRAAAPSQASLPEGAPSADGVRWFATAAQALPGVGPSRWDRSCLEQTVAAVFDPTGFYGSSTAQSLDLTSLALDVAGVPRHWRQVQAGNFRAMLGLKATGISVGWFLIQASQPPAETPAAKHAMATACTVAHAAALAFTIASGGSAIIIALGVLGMVGCAQQLTPDPPPPAAIIPRTGSRVGFGYSWTYEIETFPDTAPESLPWFPNDQSLAPVARVHVDVNRPLSSVQCDNGVGQPVYSYDSIGFALLVRIQRGSGATWQDEGYLHYSEQRANDDQWRYVGVEVDGDPAQWSVHRTAQPAKRLLELDLEYYGEKKAGLLRFDLALLPQAELLRNGYEFAGVFPPLASERLYTAWLDFTDNLADPARPPVRRGPEAPPSLFPPELATSPFATCRGYPLRTAAQTLRGVGALLQPPNGFDNGVAIVRDLTTRKTLTHTFDAVGSSTGSDYRYYWDFGLGTREAWLTTDDDTDVRFAFPPGDHVIELTVVASDGRVVAFGSHTVHAAPADTESHLQVSRTWNLASIKGSVRNPELCVTYTLQIAARTVQPPACATEHTFDETQDLLPGAALVRLDVTDVGAPRTLESLTVTPQPVSSTVLRDTGKVVSSFHANYVEIDYYTVNIPPGHPSAALNVSATPGVSVAAIKADATLRRWLDVSRDLHTLTLAKQPGDVVAGEWWVFVYSNGHKGSYEIRDTTRIAAAPPVQPAGETRPGAQNTGVQDPTGGRSTDRIVFEETFDGLPSLKADDYGGRGAWHMRVIPGTSDGWASMAYRKGFGYDRYENDFLSFVAFPDSSAWNGPLTLDVTDWSWVKPVDDLDHQYLTVTCAGLDENGRLVSGEKVATDLRGFRWYAKGHDFGFRCDDVPAVNARFILVMFHFSTGYHSPTRPLAFGWFLNELKIRTGTPT